MSINTNILPLRLCGLLTHLTKIFLHLPLSAFNCGWSKKKNKQILFLTFLYQEIPNLATNLLLVLLASIGGESTQTKFFHQVLTQFVLFLIFNIKILLAKFRLKTLVQLIQWFSVIMILDLYQVVLMVVCEVLISAHHSVVIFSLIKDLNNNQSYKQFWIQLDHFSLL